MASGAATLFLCALVFLLSAARPARSCTEIFQASCTKPNAEPRGWVPCGADHFFRCKGSQMEIRFGGKDPPFRGRKDPSDDLTLEMEDPVLSPLLADTGCDFLYSFPPPYRPLFAPLPAPTPRRASLLRSYCQNSSYGDLLFELIEGYRQIRPCSAYDLYFKSQGENNGFEGPPVPRATRHLLLESSTNPDPVLVWKLSLEFNPSSTMFQIVSVGFSRRHELDASRFGCHTRGGSCDSASTASCGGHGSSERKTHQVPPLPSPLPTPTAMALASCSGALAVYPLWSLMAPDGYDDVVQLLMRVQGSVGKSKSEATLLDYDNFFRTAAGSKPDPVVMASLSLQVSGEGRALLLPIAVPLASGVFLFFMVFLCVFMWIKYKGDCENSEEQLLLPDMGRNEAATYTFVDVKKGGGERGPEICVYSFFNLLAATNDFSDDKMIGRGGFGPVYKGKLPDGQEVAIKRLSTQSAQGLREFKTEILIIARLQHKNLVRLLGCCIHREERLLIYEYMSNKSLDFFLFDPERATRLDWGKRVQIMEGIAQGLLYLHKYSRLTIIHRDLKASNILLDNEMNPKISDFGMARIISSNQDKANTNRIVGTYGYMSPEYAMEGRFSVKSDVFSFGVLILEIVSGMKNIGSHHHFPVHGNLLGYAWELWNAGKELELVDPSMGGLWHGREASRCTYVGLMCVQERADDRPTMAEVVAILAGESVAHQVPKQPAFPSGDTTRAGSSTNSMSGLQEFKTEILIVARLQHKNLVRLLGCCIHKKERLLIYEYMPNKSLDFLLFDPERAAQLDWSKRAQIMEGIAQGLLYLHKYSRLTIIHRDLKASNILLDSEMNPKISDFGMARIFSSNQDQANTNRIVGTYGYMSPEYAMAGRFSVKSDVFSFGVLLLEIVSGMRNIGSHHYFPVHGNLLGYAWELRNAGKELELVDPSLGGSWRGREVSRCVYVGLMCVQDCADDRPTMAEVVGMLAGEIPAHQVPKQPAFFPKRDAPGAGGLDPAAVCSINSMTMSTMEGR
ncbi:hypothetical protein Taro_019629 [Colocasia esculenta]|uniref:Protein kinase domain-containing protein n=1 Tax=Colocasia esculenta TaxID=4460 RepID=A0A843UUA4_COLES|nr:hypothetical protein [Colocasia esculenta]